MTLMKFQSKPKSTIFWKLIKIWKWICGRKAKNVWKSTVIKEACSNCCWNTQGLNNEKWHTMKPDMDRSRSKIVGYHGKSKSIFKKLPKSFSKGAARVYVSTSAGVWVPFTSYPGKYRALSVFLVLSVLVVMWWYLFWF